MNVATFSVLVSLPLLAIACNCQASPVAKTTFAWVIKVLEEMLIVKPDMTREQLLKVFVTEGGLSYRSPKNLRQPSVPVFQGRREIQGCRPTRSRPKRTRHAGRR
jgi:hypothetical protein